jgi:Secretion system C-terminal sorting domain
MELLQLSVYPNPASSELTIDLKGEKIESTKVIAINGQLMLQSNSVINKLNISELPANIYFIEAKTSNGIYRTKFVKQ